jgi:hypothetical protein
MTTYRIKVTKVEVYEVIADSELGAVDKMKVIRGFQMPLPPKLWSRLTIEPVEGPALVGPEVGR